MKVLIVASYNKKRYAPFIVEQAEALRQAGCEIDWYGVQGKGIAGYLKAIPHLRAKIREFKPDIIHAHYGLSCLLANLATRYVPVVSTYHGSDINLKKNRKFSRLAMWLSAWNIFVSKRNVDIAQLKKHWSLIPCGVALSDEQLMTREQARKELGWKATDKKVLFAGAFDTRAKNAPLAKATMALFEDVDLIELKGYSRSEVNRLMCAANCLLMTSHTEGSPQVIKEAMACGCPIVSVDVGDVAERTEGVDGCFVVPSEELRDKREELIEELAKALKNAIVFDGRTNGREKILETGLTNEQVAQKIIDIYKRVCEF